MDSSGDCELPGGGERISFVSVCSLDAGARETYVIDRRHESQLEAGPLDSACKRARKQ